MQDYPLEQEQSDMRKRWADPAYRMQHSLLKGAVLASELTLNAVVVSAEELLRRIEGDGYQQAVPKGLPGTSSEVDEATQGENQA